MALFSFFTRNNFFSEEEKQRIIDSIRSAELQTSGEIRVFLESRCRFVDPLDRAAEIFWGLKMDQTEDKNAVLVYVAIRDHQYGVVVRRQRDRYGPSHGRAVGARSGIVRRQARDAALAQPRGRCAERSRDVPGLRVEPGGW